MNQGTRWARFLGVALAVHCAGCAYMCDRGRDLGDIMTLAVEDHTLGLVVRPIVPLGICVGDGDGWGVRDGYIGHYQYTERTGGIPFGDGLLVNDVSFQPTSDWRHKSYTSFETPQLFNVQAKAGLYYGVRVGVSLAELLDFVLGWTSMDIMTDDIGCGSSNNPRCQKAEQSAAPLPPAPAGPSEGAR
jgi:hypothetical protein